MTNEALAIDRNLFFVHLFDKENRTIKQTAVTSAVLLLLGYNIWMLFSVVAWVSHLGYRVPVLSPYLSAKGYPYNESIEGTIVDFLKYNIPFSLVFILPHSFLRPPTLRKIIGNRFARLAYCTMASASLQFFMNVYRPWKTGILFTLPYSPLIQQYLSTIMLVVALLCFMADNRTYLVLGVPQAIFGIDSSNAKFPAGLSARMDIITFMGITVWNIWGGLGFILFSGISILPYDVSISDIIVRVAAALYLRARSQGFRLWVDKIESIHHIIWALRAMILFVALGTGASHLSQTAVISALSAAFVVAALMNRFEKIGTLAK